MVPNLFVLACWKPVVLFACVGTKRAPGGGLQWSGNEPGKPSAAVERQVAIHQRREFHRRKGQGRHGHGRHRQKGRPRVGPNLEGLALDRHQGKVDVHARRDPGLRRDSADLDDAPHRQDTPAGPAFLLGRRSGALDRSARGRLLRVWLEKVLPDQFAAGMRQSRQRFQLLLEHAVPQEGEGHRRESRRQGHHPLLPDQLYAHEGARRRGVSACAVPPCA